MITICLILVLILIIFNIIMTSRKHNIEKCDVIIVLGCNLKSNFMKERLKKALELYGKKVSKSIIVTGKGKEEMTEAFGMKEKLIKLGVKNEDIFLEEEAKNTYENLKFTKKIMEVKGFNKGVIISDGYHLARINMISKNIGLNAYVIKSGISCYGKYEVVGILREVPAYIKDFFISKLKK